MYNVTRYITYRNLNKMNVYNDTILIPHKFRISIKSFTVKNNIQLKAVSCLSDLYDIINLIKCHDLY